MKLLYETLLPITLTNGNDGRGSKWFSSAKVRKEVEALLRAFGATREPFSAPVVVHVTRLIEKGCRKWDSSSGLRGNWKEIEDALVVLGWFHDDSAKYITETRFFQVKDAKGGILVEVYESSQQHTTTNRIGAVMTQKGGAK